jgi:four helix bundle protein
MGKDTVRDLSYDFAIKIVQVVHFLQKEKTEYILSKQLLKSGTAIGALIREAQFAESSADFVHKLTIALKEANETEYWLSLLIDTNYLKETKTIPIRNENISLIKMLISIIKTKKKNMD